MTFREVVKVLQHIRDVLAEYAATEQRKRTEAKQRAEAEARRKVEEAVAREAELKAAQARLLAQQEAAKTTVRRRRRGDGPRTSVPLESRPLPTLASDVFAQGPADWGRDAPPSLPGLPPGILAVLQQLGRFHTALRDLFMATETSRRWFERTLAHKRWGLVVESLFSLVVALAENLARGLFRRERALAWLRKWDANEAQVDRMLEGGWKEKVRYLLWTNERRQERQAAIAA